MTVSRTPEHVYEAVARDQFTRWGYSETLGPDGEAEFVINQTADSNLRADANIAWGVAATELEQLRRLVRDLVDPDDCWFDHHGGCQAHGYLSLEPGEKCPHQEAKELLAMGEQS